MDGQKVLDAVQAIRWYLREAIEFSQGYPNQSGQRCVLREPNYGEVDSRLDTWREKHLAEHRDWQRNIEEAVATLEKEGYTIPLEWSEIDVSNPQVALLDFPIERDRNDVPTGAIWGLGAGECEQVEKIPSDGLFDTFAGDHKFRMEASDWRYEGNKNRREYKGIIAGVFDDSLVRSWEGLLESIESEERDLQRQRLSWEESGEAKKPDTHEVPPKKTAGRPSSTAVAARREKVGELLAKGKGHGDIAAELKVSVDIVKADIRRKS